MVKVGVVEREKSLQPVFFSVASAQSDFFYRNHAIIVTGLGLDNGRGGAFFFFVTFT